MATKTGSAKSAKWEEQHLAKLEKLVARMKKKYERNGALSTADLLSFQSQVLKELLAADRPAASW